MARLAYAYSWASPQAVRKLSEPQLHIYASNVDYVLTRNAEHIVSVFTKAMKPQ